MNTFVALLAASITLGSPAAAAYVSAAPADSVPLFDGLGDLHMEVTTDDPLAQRYFDQGLRLVWAFNHAEAIRSFEQAGRIDASCAMCRWGVALAHGPNINAGMDSTSGVAAHEAIREALALAEDATARERAYIRAMAERYAPVPPVERAALDSAYARAMEGVVERWPDDPDALVLAADARMNLSPWNYWEPDGSPRPGTDRILALLERAREIAPDHPGACHLWIHAVEAAHPERGVECAEHLAELMPAAGHVVHMPGHIYLRVGRYMDTIEANRHAIHADEEYIEDRNPDGLYRDAYYPHNYHFLAFAAMMAGRGEEAISAARAVAEKTPPEIAREIYFLESTPAYPHLMMVAFGRWDAVLAEPRPSPDLTTGAGLAEYARGVAHAAKGEPEEAIASLGRLARFASIRAAEPPSVAENQLAIAIHALAGELALRTGDPAEAVLHFGEAAKLEDQLQYDEPPLWYYPIRWSLGRALLEAGRPGDAERAYRRNLRRFPENGWALFGLARALEAQGETGEAAAVRARFDDAWRSADVELMPDAR